MQICCLMMTSLVCPPDRASKTVRTDTVPSKGDSAKSFAPQRIPCGIRSHSANTMEIFQWILVLLVGAVCLTAIARRINVPYPSLLALGGVALALLPTAPRLELDPELMLALFVAPVLLDAAYDTSVRDLRANWIPITCLVIAAVGITTAAVAWTVHALVPGMPWAAAIALGAIVAPPDAAAASAILKQLSLPHRLLVILQD